jgi:hypothetical protein
VRCAANDAIDMVAVRQKLATLLERQVGQATAAQIEERAEQLALQRLAALKQEHAIG